MTERASAARGAIGSSTPDIEAFLSSYIRANPGLHHGAIIQAARTALNISRATAALHLSRLVQFGEVIRVPDRTYVVGGSDSLDSRAVLEIRRFDEIDVIRPDGSVRAFLDQEIRVVKGQLEHLEFPFVKPLSQVDCWCASSSKLSLTPRRRAPYRIIVYTLKFSPPLTAREAAWQRVCMHADGPKWYRMARDPTLPLKGRVGSPAPSVESESIVVRSQGPRFGNRFGPGAHLRLRVVLPEGFPVGSPRFRVRYGNEQERTDSTEEARLSKLGLDEWHHDGFRRLGTTLSLSVPQPQLDRIYEIEWGLPTTPQLEKWLTYQRQTLTD